MKQPQKLRPVKAPRYDSHRSSCASVAVTEAYIILAAFGRRLLTGEVGNVGETSPKSTSSDSFLPSVLATKICCCCVLDQDGISEHADSPPLKSVHQFQDSIIVDS